VTTGELNLPAEPAVREQLERILASTHFAAAEGARKLLRFLVEEKLSGRGQRLKEYTLAVEVFGRDPSFDSKTNPAVRVEASRLRRRLERYYLTLGREDPVLIELPRGSYVPGFLPHADVLHLREDLAEARAAHGGVAATESLAMPGGPSIAVMPFENLGDESGAPFADGITIEIVTALSRFREFRVLGRSTVLNHRGERDAVRLHAELGARYVLAGSVRLAESRLRVHAELLSGADGTVLWAEGFERDLQAGSIFEVQDEIANHVVATIAQPHGVIGRPAAAVAMRKAPGSLDAYECLLLFYDYGANHSPERHLRVRAALEAETRKEPDAAALWAALSMVHNDTWRFGFNVEGSREQARDEALRAARKAVQTDPLNPLGYHALFLVNFARGDLKGFREAGNRAIELNPNHTDILADYGLHLTMCDDWTLGRVFLKVALSLNPEPPDWYWFPFFIWHFENGEYDAALDFALRSQNQAFFWTHGMHAMAYTALDMRDEAAAAVARLLHVYPEFPAKAREELARWVSPERRERTIEVLRRAGLLIPEDDRVASPDQGGGRRSGGPGGSAA
jgi:TolB-like protein